MASELYKSIEFLTYLSDIVSRYAKNIKKNNDDEVHMRCPICGDSKKSLSKARGHYYKKSGSYYCFNCGEYMPGLKFASLVSEIDEKSIISEFSRDNISSFVAEISGEHSSIFEEHVNIDPPSIIYPNVRKLNNDEIQYLSHRRIVELPFFDSLDFNGVDAKQGQFIFIPWFMEKKLLNFQIHNYKKYKMIPKYLFSKKGIKPIFGLDRIDPSFKKIVVFEGVFDSLFVKNGVSIGGKTLTKFQEYVFNYKFPEFEIVIALDQDNPGMSSMAKIAENSSGNFKYFLPNLNGCKDINDYAITSKIDLKMIGSEEYVNDNSITDIELLEKKYNA